MLQYCCAGMLACVSNVVMEVEGVDVVWSGVVAGSGVTRSNYPTEYSHLPSTKSQASRLNHALYGLYDILQLISKLQDLPHVIETSGDDCSAWRQ